MNVLLTNDDGIGAPGLAALAARLSCDGHDVLVVAPEKDCSGSGAAIGPIGSVRSLPLRVCSIAGVAGVRAYALQAPPAMCTLAVLLRAFDFAADLVVSGINAGPNTGQTILHSGTVGAVLTAANLGHKGLAVSHAGIRGERDWGAAAELASRTVRWMEDAAGGTVLNLNVPDLPRGTLPPLRLAALAPLNGEIDARIDRSANGDSHIALDFGPGTPPSSSDAALLRQGYASITAIAGVATVDIHLGELTNG